MIGPHQHARFHDARVFPADRGHRTGADGGPSPNYGAQPKRSASLRVSDAPNLILVDSIRPDT
jgi:hypothetical protein